MTLDLPGTCVSEDYAQTFMIERTTIHIVAPEIVEEERMKRLNEIHKVIQMLWNRKDRLDDQYVGLNPNKTKNSQLFIH